MSKLAGDISKRIRAVTGWSQQRLAERLDVSRNYVALIETGAKTPSTRLLSQLEQVLGEVDKGSRPQTEEFELPYRVSGSQQAHTASGRGSSSSKMLDPRFQPRAEPTAQMCADYFAEYLKRAERESGGVGYAWRLLQKTFPLDEFEPKPKAPP